MNASSILHRGILHSPLPLTPIEIMIKRLLFKIFKSQILTTLIDIDLSSQKVKSLFKLIPRPRKYSVRYLLIQLKLYFLVIVDHSSMTIDQIYKFLV